MPSLTPAGLVRDTLGLVASCLLPLSQSQELDKRLGGFGNAPKFPRPSVLNLMDAVTRGLDDGKRYPAET